MKIVDLSVLSPVQVEQLASITFEAAREHSRSWLLGVDDAREELVTARGKFSRVALDDAGNPMAWVSAARWWGRLWELHPLVVGIAHQKRGYGRALVREVEDEAARSGALTLCVSTSDTEGDTSLSGVDLFDAPLRQLSSLHVRSSHAVQFWQRIGFQIVGVTPDAEAPGQPSICLAKRVART